MARRKPFAQLRSRLGLKRIPPPLPTAHHAYSNTPLSSSSSLPSSSIFPKNNSTAAVDAPLPMIKKKHDKDNWHIWQRSEGIIHGPRKQQQCDWTRFAVPGGSTAIQICVHKRDDISDAIKRDGKWFNCEQNTRIWKKQYMKNSNYGGIEKKVFVDIGANIGACVFEMLLATDAHIIAFEPSPRNLFYFTSTLSRLHPVLSSRVTLFPIGVGDQKVSEKLFGAVGNYGNSIVGGAVRDQDRPGQKFSLPETIHIEALQNILNESHPISLMKIDAQGYECNILRGMGPSAHKMVNTILTEVAPRWLRHHRCSSVRFFQIARQAGFQIKLTNGVILKEPIGPQEPNDYDVVLSPIGS